MLTAWHRFARRRVPWVRWEVEVADCWVGVFWRDDPPFAVATDATWRMCRCHAWICLVPMLPLHISWLREVG